MNIGKDTVVTITYIVKDMDGKLLEESDEPVSYLHGGYDNIFPLVEQALEGKAVGETVDLDSAPAAKPASGQGHVQRGHRSISGLRRVFCPMILAGPLPGVSPHRVLYRGTGLYDF